MRSAIVNKMLLWIAMVICANIAIRGFFFGWNGSRILALVGWGILSILWFRTGWGGSDRDDNPTCECGHLANKHDATTCLVYYISPDGKRTVGACKCQRSEADVLRVALRALPESRPTSNKEPHV